MSLIRHTFSPRSRHMDHWMAPSSFGFPSFHDIFDPFDDFDRMMNNNLMWLNRPSFMDIDELEERRQPQKYRISLDCRGYDAKSIKTDIVTKNDTKKLVVTGLEGQKANRMDDDDEDYSIKEFRKTFNLPDNVEADKMVSLMTRDGQLVVEIPLHEEEHQRRLSSSSSSSSSSRAEKSLMPRIVEDDKGNKSVSARLNLPKNIDPSKISVTCKDHDLIIKAEDKVEKPNRYSQVYYYQRSTLPENTDLSELKCHYDNNQLTINAPLYDDKHHRRLKGKEDQPVPIEYKK